jgi:anti-sigma B factor antagonist
MQFEVEKKEDFTLVRVTSEKLDAYNSTDLKSQMVFISSQGEKNIVVDLSLCKYCDSSGLRALLVANRLCDEAIGACIISGLQPDVENIFRISMLHTVLLITKTVDEAVDLLKKKNMLQPDVKDNDV